MSTQVINESCEGARDSDFADQEKQQPLKRSSPSVLSREHAFGAVAKGYGDLPLLVCSFVSGLVDAASFRNWGMFVSMQTGNTVILGLSTAGLPSNPHAWLTTLISILSFLIGAFTCFRLSKVVAPHGPTKNRLWTSFLFASQGLLLLLSAGLATAHGLIPQNPGGLGRNQLEPADVIDNIRIVSLIPPLAFQSGIQIATSRLLGFNELPVNVLTSTYCDIMGDYQLFAPDNAKRNRRLASVVLLLVGAIVGGWLLRTDGALMSVLWVGGGMKFLAGVAVYCFMPAVKETLA